MLARGKDDQTQDDQKQYVWRSLVEGVCGNRIPKNCMFGEVWLKVYVETWKEKAYITGQYSDAFLNLQMKVNKIQ